MISIAAYYLYKERHVLFSIKTMKLGVLIALTSCIFQFISADSLARFVAKAQPEKLAAFEGVFETKSYTPAYVFGWVDGKTRKTHGLKVPGLLSLMIYRDAKKPVPGLNEFNRGDWPMVQSVFQFYHIMVVLWGFMFLGSLIGLYMWIKKKWSLGKWPMRFLIISAIFPQIANISGWYATEMGRQPWTVYKLLRTADAISPGVTLLENWISLILLGSIYVLLFVLFLVLIKLKVKNGPIDEEHVPYTNPFKN